jgi:antitoxin (DNA-binding transcriptional repressor) of toxin-antitoxin stability system
LVELASAGEEIIIAKAGKPIAKLTIPGSTVETPQKRSAQRPNQDPG